MSFATEIAKTQLAAFAELYEVKTQNTTYYYTSFAQDVTWNGYTYLARAISRGELSVSDRLRAMRVRISVPLLPAILQYIATAPPQATVIKITRKFIYTDDAIQIFLGHAVSITIEKNIAAVECESETRLLRNKVPKHVFQAFCNHSLFDSGCTLLSSNYDISAVLTAVDGSTIKAAEFDALPDYYFRLGYVSYSGDIRLITNHVGDTITLQIPFPSLVIGNTVHAFPGCDKSFATCRDKFSNEANRLAFDNIPSSNPCIFGLK